MAKPRINNGRVRKEERRNATLDRQESRDKRSDEEQLQKLDAGGHRAKKERAKLKARIQKRDEE